MVFFFQAEDGIRDLVRSRGLGDVYKRQKQRVAQEIITQDDYVQKLMRDFGAKIVPNSIQIVCLLYTSDAADDLLCVDLGGRRIIKKKKNITNYTIYRL